MLISIEAVYARAGRHMCHAPSRSEGCVVVGYQEFHLRRVERGWLREHDLPQKDLELYRLLSSRARAAVRRVVDGVMDALGEYVGSFAPDKVARVRYWQRHELPWERWVELFHKLMLAELGHFDQRCGSGALRSEGWVFRTRLQEACDRWVRALNTPRVSVHDLHATLTVASLVLLHAVERAVTTPKPRHLEVILTEPTR